ncbi:hypothetical protein GCM10029976_054890 [Kribbella albertanoniae]
MAKTLSAEVAPAISQITSTARAAPADAFASWFTAVRLPGRAVGRADVPTVRVGTRATLGTHSLSCQLL